jgi:cAMP phosphodiesterase
VLAGMPQTIKSIKEDFLNDRIWPDFSKIALSRIDTGKTSFASLALSFNFLKSF